MNPDENEFVNELKPLAPKLRERLDHLKHPPEWANRAFQRAILNNTVRFLGPHEFQAAIISILSEAELDAFDVQERLKKLRVQLRDMPAMATFGVLHKLEALDWIEARTAVRDGTETRLYRSTEKGRVAARKNIPQEIASWIEALHLRGETGQ